MAPVSHEQRRKRWHTKVSTGCSTCKQRRIKCDETKPVCVRCSSAGRTCEGYQEQRTWIFVPLKTTQTPSPDPSTTRLPITSMPSLLPQDPYEQRAVLYFLENTSRKLTGFTSYTNRFWTTTIPQLRNSEPAIHHIVVALASRHEYVSAASSLTQPSNLLDLCVKHHTMALQLLTQTPARSNIELGLISCIAFMAFENLNDPGGERAASVDYLVSGLRILDEQSSSGQVIPSNRENLIESLIRPMLSQVNLVLSMFCSPAAGESGIIRGDILAQRPQLPAEFQNLSKARDAFFEICRWRYSFLETDELWSISSKHFRDIRALLSTWHDMLIRYRESISQSNPESDTSSASNMEIENATILLSQKLLMAGAISYSARNDVPDKYRLRPESVDLSQARKTVIRYRVSPELSDIDLSCLNRGRPPIPEDGNFRLWPTASRLIDPGNHDIIQLTISI